MAEQRAKEERDTFKAIMLIIVVGAMIVFLFCTFQVAKYYTMTKKIMDEAGIAVWMIKADSREVTNSAVIFIPERNQIIIQMPEFVRMDIIERGRHETDRGAEEDKSAEKEGRGSAGPGA